MSEESENKSIAIEVIYCPRCGMPPEYCEFTKEFEQCKPWIKENFPDLYEDIDNLPSALAKKGKKSNKKTKDSDNNVDDVADNMKEMKVSSDGKKGDDKKKKKKKKKKKNKGQMDDDDDEPAEILISTATRGRKKQVTIISGLEEYGIKLKDAAKACSKRFASSSSVQKNPTGDKEILIQGDVTFDIGSFIVKKWNIIPKNALFLVGKKNKKTPVTFYDSDEDEEE